MKEAFLADLDIHDSGEVSDGAVDDATAADATAATDATAADAADSSGATDAATTTTVSDATTATDSSVDDSTTTVVDSTSGDTQTGEDIVLNDVTSGSDVTLPDDQLEGLGWRAALPGLPIADPVVFTGASGAAVALPVVNGSAVELRTWSAAGVGQWSATVQTGTQLDLSGGAFCGDELYVSAVEHDHSKAYVAQLDPSGTTLHSVSFYPKPGSTGGSVALGGPRCGGPGTYVLLDPVGDTTYKAPGGGTVQLTAAQTLNRSFIVDLDDAFGATGTLGTVSADKIGVVLTAAADADAKTLFYVGEARAVKQLGATTLQPGDQLIYSHDYVAETGGTASSTGFFGDNDIRGIAAAADGRFAVYWRAVTTSEEQRVTAFDKDGKSLGVAVVSKDAPIGDMRWEGETLVLAGTFTGAPPYPGGSITSGTWLAVMQVGASMTVVRSAAFSGGLGPLRLHRVTLSGDCAGSAWAVLLDKGQDGVAAGALADAGAACHSDPLVVGDVGDSPRAALLDASGNYVFATGDFIQLVRLRAGRSGAGP
ncbi:MAG: hypothetical protein U1F43_07805 [Myxococcota bacterium]